MNLERFAAVFFVIAWIYLGVVLVRWARHEAATQRVLAGEER